MDETFIKDIEAAKILGVSTHTMKRYRKKGIGPSYYRLNGQVRYLASDIHAFMQAQRVEPEPKDKADGQSG